MRDWLPAVLKSPSRNSLVKVAYPGADGADYHQRTWQLPPEVPADALARRLEVWLQKLIDSGDSASTREVTFMICENKQTNVATHGSML